MIKFLQKIVAGRRIAGLENQISDLKNKLLDAEAVANSALETAFRDRAEADRHKARSDQLSHDLAANIANAEVEGPKRTLEKMNDAQAARAMSRNTKQHFQAYQAAVKIMLDKLDAVARQNVVTKEDIRKLRELRIDLANQLGRSL